MALDPQNRMLLNKCDALLRLAFRRPQRPSINHVASVFVLLALTIPAFSQNRNAGEIRGTVTDSSGAAVPGVLVDALNHETGIVIHTQTNDSGVYDLPYVAPGHYDVTFSRQGFVKSTKTDVDLHVDTRTLDAVLAVGSSGIVVNVSDQPDLLKTESSEIGLTLTQTEVSQLPNVGRDWANLTELIPGVSSGKYNNNATGVGGIANGYLVTFNGAQVNTSNWLMDGGAVTLPISYEGDIRPPIESISEATINTSNFGAEYGNGLATLNVISKGGTNQFHGSAFEFIQNDFFQAKPFLFTAGPFKNPPLRWNEYGGTVGGPIIKNRAFLFFSYQRNPINTSNVQVLTVPTDAERNGFFDPAVFPTLYNPATTGSAGNGTFTRQPLPNNTVTSIDPVAKAIQAYFPEPNVPGAGIANNYLYVAGTPSTTTYYNWRADVDTSSKNRIITSGMITYNTYVNGAPVPFINAYHQESDQYNGQVTDVWTISPSKVNEFRISGARQKGLWSTSDYGTGIVNKLGLKNAPADTFPVINIQGQGAPFSLAGSALFSPLAQNNYDVGDSLTWNLGKHNLKLGGEWNKYTDSFAWQAQQSGTFNFSGLATRDPNSNDANPSPGVGYADFLLGAVQSWNVNLPVLTGGSVWTAQFFVQDNYKLRSNLTLNLGLRMLNQPGWKEEHNRFSDFSPTLINPATNTPGAIGFAGNQIPDRVEAFKTFFAPRIGVAWTPRPNWVVRGGFGLFAIPWGGNNYFVGSGQGFSGATGFAQSSDNLTPTFTLAQGAPPAIIPSAANRTPSLLNGQGVSYIAHDTPVSYVAQYQVGIQHQIRSFLFDVAYVGNSTHNAPFNADINQIPANALGSGSRPYPQFGPINAQLWTGRANYNSLQATAKRQFTNGLSFQVSYTLSKNLDTETGNGGAGFGGIDGYQNAYRPSLNYGPSTNDTRHTFNGSILYEIPVGKGRPFLNHAGILDEVIGGWQIASTYQLHSGTPFTPVISGNNTSNSLAGSLYPDRITSGTLDHPTIHEWFDVTAFVAPNPNRYGTSGRNVLYGPHFRNVDLSLSKHFATPFLGEKGNIEFRADAFNAFNITNFGLPNAGLYPGTNSDGSPNFSAELAGGAGTITNAYAKRNLQLGATIRF